MHVLEMTVDGEVFRVSVEPNDQFPIRVDGDFEATMFTRDEALGLASLLTQAAEWGRQ